jgi:DUF4097 and DUF4098 domain-containing protein YvlB
MDMNKAEYLNALKEALKNTDHDVMEEIVSDYEEHFQVGIENGKSEEQICEDLGSIEDLVKEIKEVYNTEGKEKKKETNDKSSKDKNTNDNQTDSKNKKYGDWHFNIDMDSEKIGNVINSALDTAGEAISNIDVVEIGNTIKNTLDQAASSLNNFADSYLKNQSTNPFDSKRRNAEGCQENVTKSYETAGNDKNEETASNEPIKTAEEQSGDKSEVNTEQDAAANTQSEETKELNLDIDGLCADIKVIKSANDKLNISYENNGNERQKMMYDFYSYKEGKTVYAGVRRIGKSVFFFNLKENAIKINIELPENMSNVNIKTTSGEISISGIKADQIITETANGDVSINGVYTTDFRIKCSSGDISIYDVNSIKLIASTLSGNVKVKNIEAKDLSLKSSSGDVEAGNITADIIDNSSLSGDLNLSNIKSNECRLRSTSGDIDINKFTMSNADVSSVSGDINLSNISGNGLRACSTSGDVTLEVSVTRCHASSRSGDVDIKCNGDVVLESSSISGNVNVHLKNNGNGYRVNSRTTSGELYINYSDVHQRNLKTGSYTFGNQGSELNLGSVSGDIHLKD